MGEFSRDLLHEIRALHDEFGPLGVIQDGGQRVAFLFSPELNQQVLSDTNSLPGPFLRHSRPEELRSAAAHRRPALDERRSNTAAIAGW